MRVLLLGVGMQGKATLHDLLDSHAVTEVVAADRDVDGLESHVAACGYGGRVRCEAFDATDEAAIDRVMASAPDVAIDLLPGRFMSDVAKAAVRHGIHLVNTNYVTPDLSALNDAALTSDVAILPECGMDPGLDLVMLGEAVRSLDRVTGLRSYGAGIPAPSAADGPLRYKASWTFEGVLHAYRRDARLIRDGVHVRIDGSEIFRAENMHHIQIDGLGRLEAYPNGDALKYLDQLGLDESTLGCVGRFTLRWPGHCALWRALGDLGLLDETPVVMDGVPVDRLQYLAAALEPHLQYAPHEQDVAVLRVEVEGQQAGRRVLRAAHVMDWRDLESGLTAVSRLTGFMASIGAHMIAEGAISKRGLLSPLTDLPLATVSRALAIRGIHVSFELDTAS